MTFIIFFKIKNFFNISINSSFLLIELETNIFRLLYQNILGFMLIFLLLCKQRYLNNLFLKFFLDISLLIILKQKK